MPLRPTCQILIVDDFSTMRRIVRATLRELGYERVEEAENGRQGLDKLVQGAFALVIADWNMPEMNGLELVKAMRADDDLRDIPVLMVTAEAIRKSVIEAVRAGVNGYIVKPFTTQVLEGKLKEIFP